MRGSRVDPLAALVAAAIVSLGLYVTTMPSTQVFAPAGAVLVSPEGRLSLNFTVTGSGGRLLGNFTASNETWTWIHPASETFWHGATAHGVCSGYFDTVFPPDRYTISFASLAPNLTLWITEPVRVEPTTAPPNAIHYGLAGGTECPPQP